MTAPSSNDESVAAAASYAYFRTLPWCNVYLDSPAYISLPTIPRTPPLTPNTTTLFTRTLNTPTTIPYSLSFYLQPIPSQDAANVSPPLLITHTITLMHLGSMLNGHQDTAHGGISMVIMDEAAGVLLRAAQNTPIKGTYTVYMNTKFRKPVRTPATVVVEAWFTRVEDKGRKRWVEIRISNEAGESLSEGEALFVRGQAKEDAKL